MKIQRQKSQKFTDTSNNRIEPLPILILESKSSYIHVYVSFDRELWKQKEILTANYKSVSFTRSEKIMTLQV